MRNPMLATTLLVFLAIQGSFSYGLAETGGSSKPLQISSVSPIQNAINVPSNTDISVSFDSTMDSTTINDSTFIAHGHLSGLHPGTITYVSATRTATLDPASDFLPGEVVMVILTNAITDSAGNPIGGFVWNFTIIAPSGTGVLSAPRKFSTPGDSGSFVICTALLDNNNDLDLVVINNVTLQLSVLFGQGDGTFSAPTSYSVGNNPSSIACGDLDRDGDNDCIVSNEQSNSIFVFLNDGFGGLSYLDQYATGTRPKSIFISDFDRDGNPDVATANNLSNDVSIFLGNGDGTFQPRTDVDVGGSANSVHGGDFDGDGDIDLAVSLPVQSEFLILINDGTANFSLGNLYDTGNKPSSIYAASLNSSDDYLDLALSNRTAISISRHFGFGDGTFGTVSIYPVLTIPLYLFCSDMDSDNDLDAVVSSSGSDSMSLLFNDGSGNFPAPVNFAAGDEASGCCAGDFNNDGSMDIAVACQLEDSGIVILLNESDSIPPSAPQNLTANGSNPSPWSNDPTFEINWINPPDSSGIKRGLYKLDTTPTSNYDTTGSMSGIPPDSAAATVEQGQMLYLWLEDNAGNTDYQNYATVELRYDSTPPFGSDAASPLYSTTLDFTVNWTAGADSGGSGISGYNVKVKDGAVGAWTDWLFNHPNLSDTYTGIDGHIYYFEAVAQDSAGNVETLTAIPECSTLVDITRPNVITTYPADGDTSIPVNANVSATFSEQMDTTRMIPANFSLVGSQSGNHGFVVQYSTIDSTVYLNPAVNFGYSESVSVSVSRNVTYLAGNIMVSDKIWTFVTGTSLDTLGPVTSSSNATPNPTEPVAYVGITAFVSDVGMGDNIVNAAEFFIDAPGANGTGYGMSPLDSIWDEIAEDVAQTLDTEPLGWAINDTHLVFIHGMDAPGNWGAYDTISLAVIADDDTSGPSFADFTPIAWPDTAAFSIECQITDLSGIFDDSTGSTGQGVYLLWDNDGEITVDAFEETMSNTVGSYYGTDAQIPTQQAGANFVYQIYAYDDDFDTDHPGDRTQDSSGVQQVNILDVRGPNCASVNAIPNPTNGATLLALSGIISDSLLGNSTIQSAEFFIDDTGTSGTGYPMLALDGVFDEVTEDVTDTLDISSWQYGTTHLLFVHGHDSAGNWGSFDSVLIYVTSAEDTIPPYIVAISPDSGELGVTLNRNVFITFSEPIDTTTLDTTKFHITGSINPVYTYLLSYDSLAFAVQLDPDSLFAANETISVVVDQAVGDTAGNGMAGPFSFFFVTGSGVDTIGPLVTAKNAYPDTTQGAHFCLVSGTISDVTTGLSSIAAAELFIDSTGANGTGVPFSVTDSVWDEIIEDVYRNIDISSFSIGDHWIYLHGYDAADNWGAFDSLLVVVTADDDTMGPTFSAFLPDSAPDTAGFTISCAIVDPSGVYDDSTGSNGQGVYLLWDNDGELSVTANEMRMSQTTGDTFAIDQLIPQQSKDAIFVYEVYAYDNDYDFNESEDRTQSQSSIQTIVVYDALGPSTDYVTISPPSPPEGISQVVVYATISDSLYGLSIINGAETFLDSIGSTGTGYSMQPFDGAFDSILEVVLDTVSVSGWMAGDTHTFYVHGRDENGNWGNYDSASVFVTEYVDTIPPWISITSPDSGEIDVSLNTWIYATFSEKVDPATVTSEKLLIDGEIAGIYTFWMSYNSFDSTLSINPYNDFAPYESVDVFISSGIQDLAGNTMTSSYWWWFKTGAAPDTSPPIVDTIAVSPDTIILSTYTVLTATLSDNREVSNAEYFIDAIGINGSGYPVQPVDSFGSPSVDVFDTIAVDTLPFGLHTLYLHGVDGSGNWGNHDSVFFFIPGEDTIGPQFVITIDPSPAYIGDSITITAIPDEPIHQDSAVICTLRASDGSAYAYVLNADSASFSNTVSSIGYSSGDCSLSVSGYDLWSNRGVSSETFTISPRGEFLPKESVYAWPNPVKQNRVFFHFYVNQNAEITVDIFNLEGKRVAEIRGQGEGGNPPHLQTSNALSWNVSNVASDIYLFRLTARSTETADEKSVIKKFAIVK